MAMIRLMKRRSYGGFCSAAFEVSDQDEFYDTCYDSISQKGLHALPELVARKPKKDYRYPDGSRYGYWWAPRNMNHRIKILKEIIASM